MGQSHRRVFVGLEQSAVGEDRGGQCWGLCKTVPPSALTTRRVLHELVEGEGWGGSASAGA